MNCMKCGRDISEGQVFCPDCLEVMQQYPVKPGTAVQLPRRAETVAVKKSHPKRRQPPTPEEQIRTLKGRIRGLVAAWLVTLLLFLAALYPAVLYLMGQQILLPGQNYSTFSETVEP